MGFYADTLTTIQAAIAARLAGGEVEEYSLPSGESVKTCPIETLLKWEESYSRKAAEEGGASSFRLARLRPSS